MSRPAALLAWQAEVSSQMPSLNRSLAWGLALWSYGMVLTQSCGLTTVATFVALVVEQRTDSVRQQLREWCYDSADKRGRHRSQVEVEHACADLLRWLLPWWADDCQQVALALDATTLRQTFTVLALSVVYRGSAVPVAWVVLPATQAGAWRPHWAALLRRVAAVIPTDWQVLVLTDRGLYSRPLFQQIVAHGWHPFMRINQQGLVRLASGGGFRPLRSLVAADGQPWAGRVTCFATPGCQLACTLLACWEGHHREAWLIVTDLAPQQADAHWYAMRAWIEAAFKDTKRGGWHWEQTKMTDPARAARLWLAMAVATLWVLSVGGAADASLPASSLAVTPQRASAKLRPTRRSRARLLSCFRCGILLLLAATVRGDPLPRGRFYPEPWSLPRPTPPDPLPLLC